MVMGGQVSQICYVTAEGDRMWSLQTVTTSGWGGSEI